MLNGHCKTKATLLTRPPSGSHAGSEDAQVPRVWLHQDFPFNSGLLPESTQPTCTDKLTLSLLMCSSCVKVP